MHSHGDEGKWGSTEKILEDRLTYHLCEWSKKIVSDEAFDRGFLRVWRGESAKGVTAVDGKVVVNICVWQVPTST